MGTFYRPIQTCRICKKTSRETPESLVKYGVRHYAHLSCALAKFGEPFLSRLSLTALEGLSFRVLNQHNLLDAARARAKELRSAYATKNSSGLSAVAAPKS